MGKMSAEHARARLLEKEEYNEIFDEEGNYIGYPTYLLNVDWEEIGNPPAWCESTTTYVEATSLCQSCSQYDFKKLLEQFDDEKSNPDSFTYTIPLGTIDTIASRAKECSFCQFILTVAMFSYRESGVTSNAVCTLKRNGHSYSKNALLSVDCTDCNTVDGIVRPNREKELILWHDNSYTVKSGTMEFLPTSSPTGSFPLLSAISWLVGGCIAVHPKCRQQAMLGLRMSTKIFVIDVQVISIVQAPIDCKYAALSYVWGPQVSRRSHTNPIKISEQRHVEFPEDVPPTIFHAMNVAKQLGFRYLWVDQLCIPEDCRESQISEMDKIYRNATLTIVAAVQDAEFGLPGVGAMNRKRHAPPILRVNGLNIGVRLPYSLYRALEDTIWESRGWTFQEKALSSRQLVFTEDDIYYRCLEGEMSEFDCHKSNEIKFTRGTLVQLGGVLATAHGRVPFQIYGDCVDAYTARNLTFPTDILNGFAGLMSFLSDKFHWKFCWGLPDDNFGLALLWMSSSTARRDARDARGRAFPSWSWAGWLGTVSYYSFRPKGLKQAEGIYEDFIAATWDCAMVENAAESGIIVLQADCVDIIDANSGIFQDPTDWGTLKPFEGNQVEVGNVFIAIVLLKEKQPHVRGLMIKLDGAVAHRVGVAGVDPEMWLGTSRASRRIQLA